ncbi:MAG: helix-turn-helix domain-containing protein [Clostridia bacterium]|nr:helix-turn-helix domain-containing protein [Clostridia bacterium]
MAREKNDYRGNIIRIENMFPGEGMLTVTQAAKWLRCDRHKVAALIERGRLTAVNIGSGKERAIWRVPVESLARFSS